ncbi:MAG: hypothetical protein E5W38_02445 [Mesorhizobium sp.]|uniref:hypothetical protein n=1 Tax=Mesorhizobium sp. M1E.F.Ca.ET.063.01.1.1 TaxID=2496750 RepID=UPI00120CDCB4|nr:MAG: hypothetical protein E5W38_02445 [Mesorhizobium sp.]
MLAAPAAQSDLFGGPQLSEGFRYQPVLRPVTKEPKRSAAISRAFANRQVAGFGLRCDCGLRQVVDSPPAPNF